MNIKDQYYKFLEFISADIHFAVLLLLSFSLPLWQKLSTIILMLFIGFTIFKLKKIRFNSNMVILIIIYIVYVISEICHNGLVLKTMEMKASLFGMPLLFMINHFDKNKIKLALKYFVFGVIVSSILCFFWAIKNSINFSGGFHFNPIVEADFTQKGFMDTSVYGGNYFFGNQFSFFHQTVYYAAYINIATVIILFTPWFKNKLFYVLYFGILVFLVSNKVNLITYLMILLSAFILLVKDFKVKLITVLLLVGISFIILKINPRTSSLFKRAFVTNEFKLDREANNSLGTRLLVWDASIEIIKKNFIKGVGVSKSYDALKGAYKEKRYVVPYRERLNAHNQYLQIFIETGVLGFVLLLVALIVFILPRKTYSRLAFFLFLIFSFNFLFESYFSRYSGLICFSLFYCLISYLNMEKKSFFGI